MPPTPKITKEMILGAVMEITRETGFAAVNARTIAKRLQCSTRPIFTCYENMGALKSEFLDFAYAFFERYAAHFHHSARVAPALIHPLSYIAFAGEETHLFQLLFVDDMALDMTDATDFYQEPGNEKRARAFSEAIDIPLERAKIIFLDLFLYAHGIAVLTATKKIAFDRNDAEKMLTNVLTAFTRQAATE